jgi:molybdopterin-biosynthesis enzyme MoeA-like protein
MSGDTVGQAPGSGESQKQAAVVVVGNEVLSGDVEDHNGLWLCRELAAIGVEVGLAMTLPDDEFLLADYLRQVGARYAPVFVTGGIGTTLDDVTRQAVARAAGVPLELRSEVVADLERLIGHPLTPVQRRLAELPGGCELIPNRIGRAPGFAIGPFIVFPGVPEMLHDMFPLVAGRYRRAPKLRRTLFTSHWESEIAALLEELAARAPGVAIGSYPKNDDTRAWVEIVLKSRDEKKLEAAAAWLAERLPGQPTA